MTDQAHLEAREADFQAFREAHLKSTPLKVVTRADYDAFRERLAASDALIAKERDT